MQRSLAITCFVLFSVLAVSPWGSPPLSLLCGIVLALTLGNPFPKRSKTFSKYLLQAAVVGLGFGLDLTTVIRVGSEGLLFTAITITLTLLIGTLLARLLSVPRKSGILLSVGTAICGGSAIAAVGPVIKANDEEMSVSLGTVFILNSIALLLFPIIGRALHMSESDFGVWAALAIHDTSSVVGAASAYGKHALEVGTTVKLTRALWIIPISFLYSLIEQRYERRHAIGDHAGKARMQIPWFIGLFILASVVRSIVPQIAGAAATVTDSAKAMLSLTLFLIGAGLSRKVLKQVGVRPLVTGVLLWIIVGVSTLIAVIGVHG